MRADRAAIFTRSVHMTFRLESHTRVSPQKSNMPGIYNSVAINACSSGCDTGGKGLPPVEILRDVNGWCCVSVVGDLEKDSACPSPLALTDSVGANEKEYDRKRDCRSSKN